MTHTLPIVLWSNVLSFTMSSSPVGTTERALSFCNPNSLKLISLPHSPPSQVWRGKGWLNIGFAMGMKKMKTVSKSSKPLILHCCQNKNTHLL